MSPIERLRDKKILIIENDQDKLMHLQNLLSLAGFRNLIPVTNHQDVFEAIRPLQNKIDELGVILLSHNLPQCDIYELSKLLTTLDGHDAIPLIFLMDETVSIDDKLLKQCHQANAATVVHYPDDPLTFSSLMTLALALKNERDDRLNNDAKLVIELSERRIMEARLQYLVSHDELTGLSNRSGLEKALNFAILRCKNFKQEGALLDIDLDQFKVINDIEGHEVGDRLLIEMSTLIRSNLDTEAFIARVGSNSYQVLLSKVSQKQVVEIADQLRLTVDTFEFVAGGNTYNVSASIGVAILDPKQKINRASELMSRAHHACCNAKKLGRNKVYLYENNDIQLTTLRDDAKWVPKIREALRKDQFKLVFQPVVQVSDGRVSHYETLLRLQNEQGELLSPEKFIPVAERMGLIQQIDLWVVTSIIDLIAALPEADKDISFTVNLSSHALQCDYILPVLKQKLESTWVSPSRLTFEITETAAVTNFEKTRQMVSKIRALGCRFALDDFGAGFSSFNYIKNFPVDYLKIDGQFISNLVCDAADQVLVKSMIDVAHSLGKKAIAEYVSNAEILRLLKEFGVDYVQGFLLGKPEINLLNNRYISLSELLNKPLDIEEMVTS
ncbi:MAG: GGDEF domain-containing response regulator [Piscirickettsiaceae bacterium]|nr:MAG: GGDEF domain-containing response regulator [Piscirickettsiaceae bacterium]